MTVVCFESRTMPTTAIAPAFALDGARRSRRPLCSRKRNTPPIAPFGQYRRAIVSLTTATRGDVPVSACRECSSIDERCPCRFEVAGAHNTEVRVVGRRAGLHRTALDVDVVEGDVDGAIAQRDQRRFARGGDAGDSPEPAEQVFVERRDLTWIAIDARRQREGKRESHDWARNRGRRSPAGGN